MSKILAAKEFLGRHPADPPIIPVWTGGTDASLLLEYPVIELSDFCKSDDMCLVAGFGVCCGKNVYDRLWEEGYIAVWSDTPPN